MSSRRGPMRNWTLIRGDEVPDDKLRETLTRVSRVAKGLKASSEKADSAVSRVSNLMTQNSTVPGKRAKSTDERD